MGHKFHLELQKYYEAGCRRPPHDFPSGCMNVIVLYDGLVPIDQVGHEYRGYDYNWNIKGALVFGKTITNVRGEGGRGLQSGTKPLSKWCLVSKSKKQHHAQKKLIHLPMAPIDLN